MALDTRLTPRRIDALLRVERSARIDVPTGRSTHGQGVQDRHEVDQPAQARPRRAEDGVDRLLLELLGGHVDPPDRTKLAAAQFKSDHTG